VKRVLARLLAVMISATAAVGALRLTLPADNPADVRRQAAFLRDALEHGAGEKARASPTRPSPASSMVASVLNSGRRRSAGAPPSANIRPG